LEDAHEEYEGLQEHKENPPHQFRLHWRRAQWFVKKKG
jgi:hypothetical protein